MEIFSFLKRRMLNLRIREDDLYFIRLHGTLVFLKTFELKIQKRIILNHAKRLSHDENTNNSILEFHLGYLASTILQLEVRNFHSRKMHFSFLKKKRGRQTEACGELTKNVDPA